MIALIPICIAAAVLAIEILVIMRVR